MGVPLLPPNMLNDRLLRSWIRCRRRAWLDRHGNREKRLWTSHRTLQLNEQQRNFVALLPDKPGKGIEACKRGDYGVVGVRLKGIGPFGESLQAHPALLQRVNGKSLWGEYAYRPVVARQGRRVTKEHILSLAFSGKLLESFQSAAVPDGLVVADEGNGLQLERIKIGERVEKKLLDTLEKLKKDLKRSLPPPLASDRRKCTLCTWRGVCNDQATKEGHLSEVSGIGARRREMLKELGINSLNDLANTDPLPLSQQLGRFGEQHGEVANQLIAQARVQRDGVIERLSMEPALPELVNAPGILLYDIESDPDARDDFLHGFLHLRRTSNGHWDLKNSTYHPLLIMREHGENQSWKRLQRKLKKYPEWPILHYGETESLALTRMAKRQGAAAEELTTIHKRMIDVHARLKTNWRLPLNSYGLKSVANWIGFEWHQVGVDGARALLWWRQWRGFGANGRGKPQALKWIFQYNKDDSLATWTVANWLMEKDQLMNSSK